MRLIETTLYYVTFPIGHKPAILDARIGLVTWDGEKVFFKTPFALLDCHRDPDEVTVQDLIRMAGPGYHKTREEAQAYIERQYPYRDDPRNEEIHQALCDAMRYRGDIVGPGELSDTIGVNLHGYPTVYDIARGRVKATRSQVLAVRGVPV